MEQILHIAGEAMGKIILITFDTFASKSISVALTSNDYSVFEARTVEEAAHFARNGNPDLIIIDVPNPAICFHRLQRLIENDIQFVRTPFIVFLPENTAEIKSIQKIAPVEFLRKPFEVNTLLHRTKILIEAKMISEKEASRFSARSSQYESEIHGFGSIVRDLEEESRLPREQRESIRSKIKESYLETAEMLVELVEEQDIFQAGHSRRVAEYCTAIANVLGLTRQEKETLTSAALLHDIGKIFVSADILSKPSSLTEKEYAVIKTHPVKGQRLLHSLSNMEDIADLIMFHHEQPDGNGYYRKKPDEIPMLSKIIAVAEAFDAMTTAKIHSRQISFKEAIAELKKSKGTKYDSRYVDILADHITQNNI